jgi:predicted RNA binding protein YcfA (HicA-like mRNA interferase family)
VGRWTDLLQAARASPANIRFKDLCGLVERLGFVERRRSGSHLIFRHAKRRDLPLINLQAGSGGKAKPYQVKQVLTIAELHGLEVEE